MRSLRAGPGRRRSTGSWDPRTRSRSSASWSEAPVRSPLVTARPGSPRDARSATSASPAAYGSPVSAPSGAEGGYGYSAPSAASGASTQPPPAIPPRQWYQNSSAMPSRGAQSMQYGVGAPAPAAASGAYPRPAPSGQVPMFPYSGQHPTAYQPGYSQAVAGPTAAPSAGAMAGPMAAGARRAQISQGNAPRRPGGAAPVGAGAGASPDSDACPVVHAVRGRDLQTGLDGDHRGDSDGGGRRCGPGPGRSALEPASAGRYLAVGRLPHVGHDPVVPGAFGDLCWLRFSSGLRDCVPLPHGYFLIGSGAGKIRDFWIDPATCSFLHHLPLGGRPGPSHPVAGAMGCGDTTRWRTYPQFRRPQ